MQIQHKRFRSLLTIIGLIASGNLLAQDMLELTCGACRNPNVHPSDFGNFAFNEAREPDNGYTYDQLDEMLVRNLAGRWAHVDLDFASYQLPIFEIPIPIPTGDIDITVTDPSGNLTRYTVDIDVPEDLAVGTEIGPGYNPAAQEYADNNEPPLSSEIGEDGPGLDVVEPGIYNDDNMVEIGGGIGIPDNGNYCGPGTDYICVF